MTVATHTLSPAARAIVSHLETRKGQFITASWETTPKVAAAHAGRVSKRVTVTTRSGVDYANLAVNADREVEGLPWGEWAVFPFIITHKGQEYVRLTGVVKVETRWFIDGVPATREDALALYTPSQRKAASTPKEDITAFTVKVANLKEVGGLPLLAAR